MPSSAPTMRASSASKASSDLPKATNTSPARAPSAQGIERRSMKASGSKLSCAVRFTCADAGARTSSTLSRRRRPMLLSCSRGLMAWKRSRSCTHCWTATKLAPSRPAPMPVTAAAASRLPAARIFGAVFVTGQVQALAVTERIDRVIQRKGRPGAASSARPWCSRSPRSLPRSQHHRAAGVAEPRSRRPNSSGTPACPRSACPARAVPNRRCRRRSARHRQCAPSAASPRRGFARGLSEKVR